MLNRSTEYGGADAWKRTAIGLGAVLALASASACGGGEDAQFPSNTIELIIPYAAGGSTDVSLRLMASAAEETCGVNVIASNQTGSAGAVGFTATANSAPDGYTVGATASELAFLHQLGVTEVSPSDFTGVMRYALNPHVVFVNDDSPYETIDDLINDVSSGETINVATPGTGSAAHLSLEGLAMELDLDGQFTNLPFDGDATALQALVGNQADMILMVAGTAYPQVEAGSIRPLAVAGDERLELLPDTPTLSEAGVDWESAAHLGLAVPNEVPEDVVATLDECLSATLETEEFVAGMENQNLDIDYLSTSDFDDYLEDLEEQYSEIIENSGLSS